MTPNLDLLRRLFSYDKWAIDRSLSSIKSASKTKAELLLSHILLAEKIWMTRLKGEDSSLTSTFEEFSLEFCAKMSDELFEEYTRFLDSLSEEDLNRSLTYKNLAGVEFQTPILDILLHVALHGAYHRGQIAWIVREDGGGTAVNTDYIGFTRI